MRRVSGNAAAEAVPGLRGGMKMGWVCKTCGAKDASDNLDFPMMHEHEDVEPDAGTALRWGGVLGTVEK